LKWASSDINAVNQTYRLHLTIIADVDSYNTRQTKTIQLPCRRYIQTQGNIMLKYNAIGTWLQTPPDIKK